VAKFIFGLAVAIGTLSLITRIPTKPFGMLIDIVEFGFSFLILISVWLGYWNITSVLPLEDGATVILNIALLFLVAIEPYLFYLNITFDLLAHELLLNKASMLYALDMIGLIVIHALFTHQLTLKEGGLVQKESRVSYKRVRNTFFISAALFMITILPAFWTFKLWDLPIRFYFWPISLILSLVRHVPRRAAITGARS
jgi:hypothetical protein